jgi:hypothetical protein
VQGQVPFGWWFLCIAVRGGLSCAVVSCSRQVEHEVARYDECMAKYQVAGGVGLLKLRNSDTVGECGRDSSNALQPLGGKGHVWAGAQQRLCSTPVTCPGT